MNFSEKAFSNLQLNIYGEQDSSKYYSSKIIFLISIFFGIIILMYGTLVFIRGS